MKFSRRTFFKAAGAATAGIAAVTTVPKKMLSWAEETAQKDMQQIPTFCELCFWNCGLIAKVENRKVVKIDGNPMSLRGRGRLCGRGNAALGALYDPDRLKNPMINTGKRGEPVWKQATWDEALTLIAGKMKGIKEKYGPESVALIYHGTGASFWKHLLHAYGSTLSAAPSLHSVADHGMWVFILPSVLMSVLLNIMTSAKANILSCSAPTWVKTPITARCRTL